MSTTQLIILWVVIESLRDPFTKQDMQDELYNRYPDYCG